MRWNKRLNVTYQLPPSLPSPRTLIVENQIYIIPYCSNNYFQFHFQSSYGIKVKFVFIELSIDLLLTWFHILQTESTTNTKYAYTTVKYI